MQFVKIHPDDNVAVVIEEGAAIPYGHKVALSEIKAEENVIKYGYAIGRATNDIRQGDHVHSHNLRTNLEGTENYTYSPIKLRPLTDDCAETFLGYRRPNGAVGIRNEIWIINTVGCVNKTAEKIAAKFDNVFTFVHPYGCSQLGDDHKHTQNILKNLVNHPNAGGVLVLGLGCENNNIEEFKAVLGDWDDERVKFLNVQDVEDELYEGRKLIEQMIQNCGGMKKKPIPVSELVIGLKCGGSDGLSGITANPLLGRLSDTVISKGGSCILTEVPEMFGAETILMDRCINEEVFNKTVSLINDFKEYFIRHGQVVYENPSPGNKEGGITTLEEKSLGCTQKAGTCHVTDVLDYGGIISKPGLNLLRGPGNDIVAVTNLAAAKAHLILFTTGRGTPLGGPVPTVKVSSNTALAKSKPHWIDYDAGCLIGSDDPAELDRDFFDYIIRVAEGEQTKNEIYDYREIAIFKDGVTL